jgi:predicted ATPase/class 3 adenylate cyclase
MAESHEAGTAVSPGEESFADRRAVVLTPDQRVRVFVSSTLEELAEERAAARRAIRRLHLIPVWYESGARPHPPRNMYRAYLEQSQVFVGIYWQRYGWVGPGMETSGLEDEYRLAAGMPMLLYVKRPAPNQEPGLTKMLDDIRATGTTSYREFTTAKELERLLAHDLAVLLSESFADATISTWALRQSSAAPGEPGRTKLPSGTVTFLLTDIEGSTRLWEREPKAMEVALRRHDRLLAGVIEEHGGRVITSRGEGDGFFAVFPSAVAAVEAAGVCQLRLGREEWPTGIALRVRMGLHTGEARVGGRDHVDYSPINRCARVRAAAYGGQVLLTNVTRDLVAGRLGGGFGLKQLGEFRLQDLAEPQLIFQLTHADLLADFPPIRTLAGRSGNLPLQVTSFIGRARELEQIAAALGEARVVTLTGPGGVGKTRLALQIAGQVSPRFGSGTWLCDLAPVRDVAGVEDAVAAVFSLVTRAGHTTRDVMVEFLRGKQLLLLLDNCEHLLDGAAALAGMLQRSCERLVILATSREGLGIEGERLVPVPTLGVPGADADLAAITEAEAVRLFAERADAVKPDFAVTAQNAAQVAAVVRRLDGIALAIELAAARVPAMTPAELARRLERSFGVLAAGRRGADPRHQTLRATIDWSFQLLTEPERRLLCRLAVFAGGCTLEAAETVCGGDGTDPGTDTVFELLAGLVARSRGGGPATPTTTPACCHGSATNPTTREPRCFGRGSAPIRTTFSRPGPGRSTPAMSTPRFRCWPASRPARSGLVTCCCCPAKRRSRCRARLSTGATRSLSRSALCSPRLDPIAWVPRSFAGAPPKPTHAAIPRTGESRRPSAQHAQTSRLLQAPSQTPPAYPKRRPVSRGPEAISPTRPFSSPSPRAFSYSSATRQGRFRWRGKRSRWPARSAPPPASRRACSPSAWPSPRPTPIRHVPASAKAANSASRSAMRASWTTYGLSGSCFS